MSETAKVRLVRCPKCGNLLPEVTDFSVYQCGGCGAVLRAKNKGLELDTFSEKSDEERIGSTVEKLSDRYEKIMDISERRMIDKSDGSESDVRSNTSSSSQAERRRILRDGAENNRTNLAKKEENEVDVIRDKSLDELEQTNFSQGFEDLEMYHEDESLLRRAGRVVEGRSGEKSETEGSWRAHRMDVKVMSHMKDGLPTIRSRSSYDYGNPAGRRSDEHDFNNVGDDRAELLRKLDELKEQLSRSGNLMDKGKEKVPVDRRMGHPDPYASENWYPDASLEMNAVPMQNSYPGTQLKRQPFQNQYPEPPRLMHRQELGGNDFYPPRYAPSRVQGYGDPSRSQMHRRGPHQAPAPYPISSSHNAYMSRPYPDDGLVCMDTVEPYPRNFSRHHPSCSCYQCRSKRQVSTPILPTAYGDKYSDVPNDRIFNHHDHVGPFASRDYYQRTSNPPPIRSYNAQSHARWPSDVNCEVDGFVPRRPPKVHLTSGGQLCRPIAGGAPFLMCYNCFELLLLPKKILTKNSDRKKISCGSCSTVIVFAVSSKNLVVSLDVEAKGNPVKVDSKRDVLSSHGDAHPNQSRTTFSSDDYDNSGYDFYSMDSQGRANRSNEIKNHHSTSTYTSEAEEDIESLTAAKKVTSSAPPLAGSSLQEYFEYSNKHHVANPTGEGNRSGRSENEQVLPNKTTPRQISRKESLATEIDLSSNEYCNTGTTTDSGEASRDGDHLKVGRAAESFFAGIIKKSFKDSNSSNETFEQEKASVTVNGHLIPHRLIKKAEKIAGPIHPGHYWYDIRAGFWGAMGGPCLGIIPPFIEEFNYPLPDNCAGGNTHIFVNGRELNQKDLKLLASRGLPTERDRSYIVEISGRVLDEDTGEELEGLGKLAPTVERVKHGFGMRAPKAVA
ncbi:hypothetical protein CDL12_00710 [Handroanthus impetiginosus]|uniref:Uncharacterized protein n=1 Tax=Handroanthus impetiginosus TaxID=429701 RepID=A0A2G9IA55_9LAMI|nr:hypothetical protein CDL12_00710 [Handroanthus impetiginosus]